MDKAKKQKLTEWVLEQCPHRSEFCDNREKHYCVIKYNNRCKNMDFFADFPDCPESCPHHPKAVSIKCDGGQCKRIKILINDLLTILKD